MMKTMMIAALMMTPMAAFSAPATNATASPGSAVPAAQPGQTAPAFETKDATGKTVKLADFKGKWVVLEWTNKDCPYVKKHYGAGNMQKLQKEFTGKGVAWLTVLSSAKDKQGYLNGTDAEKHRKAVGASPTAILMDDSGTIGKAYDAKTTPHMFVINPEGKIVYAGAIDDNDSADPSVIAKSKNYVAAALTAGMSSPSKPIEVASTRPYGCSVKY